MKTTTDIKKYTYWKNAEIPIVIGISGHRFIEETFISKIEQQVGDVIDSFIKQYPHSPILMLNGLAKGGDLLCARVAKKKFEEGKPVRICVVIPEEEDDYLNASSEHGEDFSPEDKNLYKEIINCKTENGRLVIDESPFIVPDMEKSDDLTRQYKFRQQSIYVATKCHVLLALWDGEKAKASVSKGAKNTACGTAAAVDFALKHNYIQPYGTEFYSAYDGAVIKILTPREGNIDENAGKCTYLTSENPEVELEKFPVKLHEILLRTDLFNRNYHNYCKKQRRILSKKEKVGENISDLIKPEDSKFLVGRDEYVNGSEKLKRIHDCCKIASELASENKKKFDGSLFVLGLLGFFLLFGFMLYDQLNALWTVVTFLLMITVLLLAFGIIKAIENPHIITWLKLKRKPCGVHTKAIEYRALSETMRVQYFLSACGVYYNVSNYFTWSHKNEIVWIKKAVTALFIGNDLELWKTETLKQKYLNANTNEQSLQKQLINFDNIDREKTICLDKIFTKWVGKDENFAHKTMNGQIGYHLKNKEDMNKKLKNQSVFSGAITCITIAAYLVLFVLELLIRINLTTKIDLDCKIFWVLNGRMLFKILLCIMSALAFFISYYYGKLALKRKATDSENMIILFRIAINRVQAIFSNDALYCTDKVKYEALRSVLKELAHEQITENGIWISYGRNNNMDLPI